MLLWILALLVPVLGFTLLDSDNPAADTDGTNRDRIADEDEPPAVAPLPDADVDDDDDSPADPMPDDPPETSDTLPSLLVTGTAPPLSHATAASLPDFSPDQETRSDEEFLAYAGQDTVLGQTDDDWPGSIADAGTVFGDDNGFWDLAAPGTLTAPGRGVPL